MHAMAAEPSCSPTWVQPAPDGATLYVACNKSDEILVIDRDRWTLVRKFSTGRAPYNLGITPDGGLLVATLKSAGQVQFFDTSTFESLAVLPSLSTRLSVELWEAWCWRSPSEAMSPCAAWGPLR